MRDIISPLTGIPPQCSSIWGPVRPSIHPLDTCAQLRERSRLPMCRWSIGWSIGRSVTCCAELCCCCAARHFERSRSSRSRAATTAADADVSPSANNLLKFGQHMREAFSSLSHSWLRFDPISSSEGAEKRIKPLVGPAKRKRVLETDHLTKLLR